MMTSEAGTDKLFSKKKALELCSGHLQGHWSTIQEDNIDVKVMKGGFVNRMYLCQNKISHEKVLIRLYGGKENEEQETNILRKVGTNDAEVLIFHFMDVNGIGPKLLGIFDGGRIEEYLDGFYTPSDQDIKNQRLMTGLARKLAKIHSLNLPLDKRPKDLVNVTRRNFKTYWPDYEVDMKTIPLPPETTEEHKEFARIASSYDFFEMIDWYEKNLPIISSKVVFSHCDVNRGNVMVNNDKMDDNGVVLIDYEFAGYNYRGCDIGHFFRRRRWDPKLQGEKGWQTALSQQSPYPDEEERRVFVKAYLQEIVKNNRDPHINSIDNEEHLMLEAEFYGGLYGLFLLSHMMTIREMMDNRRVHPAVIMGSFVQDFTERLERIENLKKRTN